MPDRSTQCQGQLPFASYMSQSYQAFQGLTSKKRNSKDPFTRITIQNDPGIEMSSISSYILDLPL